MTWTRAWIYVGVWLGLTAYYVLTEQGGPPPAVLNASPGLERTQLIVPFAGRPNRVELHSRGRVLRARRSADSGWEVLDPVGVRVPPDLVDAIVAAVTDLPDFEVVSATASPASAAEFGLAQPRARLTLANDHRSMTLQIGARNPAETAVYARREGGDEVVLLGLNVQYYIDLVMQTLERPPG